MEIRTHWVLAALGFWGCFNIFALRLNLSVGIVDMVGTPTNGTVPVRTGEFGWNEVTQGIVLGCYFYGHGIAHLPGGRLSELVSPKWLYGVAGLGNALLALVSPLVARTGSTVAFVMLRAFQGAIAGLAWPVLHTLLARWVPTKEQSFVSTFVYTGRLVGAAATMEFSGLMIHADLMGGWPSVFYIFGIVGVAWFALWSFLVSDYPSHGGKDHHSKYISGKKRAPVPWKSIMTSAPFWALAISHFGNSYGLETLMLLLPTYMSNVLGYDIKENGHLSALPFVLDALTGFAAAYIADCFIRRRILSVTAVRKVWCAFAYLGAAACFLGVSFVGHLAAPAVVLFLLSLAFSGIAAPSVFVVQIDMAPDLAGTLMGLTSFFGSAAGVLAPYVVGLLTDGQPTLDQWKIAFYIIVAVYVVTTAAFVMFGSAELQPWSGHWSEDKEVQNEKTPLLNGTPGQGRKLAKQLTNGLP